MVCSNPLRLALLAAPVLLAALLSACSSPGRSYTASGMTETLETQILANSSKMFVYRLRWPEDAIPSHIRVANSSRTAQPYEQSGVAVSRRTYARMRENAAYIIQQKGYCRSGYLELDGSVSRYHMWLKGECREDATDEDKARFGEQQIIKVSP